MTGNPPPTSLGSAGSERSAKARRRAWHRRLLEALGIIAAVLLVLRLMLPTMVANWLNQRIGHLGDYRGHLESVDLAIWRGAYRIHDLRIVHDAADGESVPFFLAPKTELSISWTALMRGAIAAEIDFYSPELNFVDRAGDEDQTGAGVDWREALQRLVATDIEELRVHDGAVHFRNPVARPDVDIFLSEINGTVSELTNADRSEGARVAHLRADARVMGGAPVKASMDYDPLGNFDDFSLQLTASGIAMPELDDFMQAYIGIDAESGTGDIVIDLGAKEGDFNGYLKLLFHDLNVFSWKRDAEQDQDNPLQLLWEGLVGALMEILSNQAEDQFALRLPFSGRVDEVRAGGFDAFLSILHNAFIEAMKPGLDRDKDDEGSVQGPATTGPRDAPVPGDHSAQAGDDADPSADGDAGPSDRGADQPETASQAPGIGRRP